MQRKEDQESEGQLASVDRPQPARGTSALSGGRGEMCHLLSELSNDTYVGHSGPIRVWL